MSRFNNLSVDATNNTATIGVGLAWDEAYRLLEPFGVMVTGGRIPGIGQLRVVLFRLRTKC